MSGLYINSGEWGGNTGLDTLSGLYTPSGLWNVGGISAAFGYNFLTSSSLPQGATFSRGTAATYYNQSGLLAYAPENLLPNSEQIDLWGKSGSTVTANAAVAPDGTTSADKIVATAITSPHSAYQTLSLGAGTFSAYLKAGEYIWAALGTGVANEGVWFDLANGVIGIAQSAASGYVITSVGNGWFRCSIYSVGATNLQILLATGNGVLTFTGNAVNGIYAWGAQFNPGSTATAYVPTTTAAVYGPRFDYDPSSFVAQNLLKYSNAFDNAIWVKSLATVTANSVVAPDETLTADEIAFSSTSGYLFQEYAITTVGTVLTFSAWLRAASATTVNFLILQNGGTSTSITASLTTEWQRFSVSFTTNVSAGAPTFVRAQLIPNANTPTLYAWGAQLNVGSTDLPYLATTSTTQAVCAPRGLLIEEARTNLLTYSTNFSSTGWGYQNSTTSTSGISDPSGGTNAIKLQAGSTVSALQLINQVVGAFSTQYAVSVYAKAGDYSFLTLEMYDNLPRTTFFNLSTGTVGTVGSGVTATIQNVGNGWYRCSTVRTTSATGTPQVLVGFCAADNAATFAPTVGYGIYVYGAQLEQASFPTSYIPTASATVTRNFDNLSITSTNFASWFNQTTGTFAIQYDVGGSYAASPAAFTVNPNGGFNTAVLGNARWWNGSTNIPTANAVTTLNTTRKEAMAYAASFRAICLNGGAVASDANVPFSGALTGMYFGNAYGAGTQNINGHIQSFSYYNSALTNAQLQQVTT